MKYKNKIEKHKSLIEVTQRPHKTLVKTIGEWSDYIFWYF